jgi:hypothetical protein
MEGVRSHGMAPSRASRVKPRTALVDIAARCGLGSRAQGGVGCVSVMKR